MVLFFILRHSPSDGRFPEPGIVHTFFHQVKAGAILWYVERRLLLQC
jgi:hypothetical protein